MAVEPTRVKKTKFSAAGGLRNIILTITFFVLRAGHTERPLFDNFIKVDLYRFFHQMYKVERAHLTYPNLLLSLDIKTLLGEVY